MKRPLILCLLLLAMPTYGHADPETKPAKIEVPTRLADSCAPRYPQASRIDAEEGVVTVQYIVNEDGRVSDVEVKKTSGYPRLGDAALDLVRCWRYSPALKDGKPFRVSTRANVKWQLKDKDIEGMPIFRKMTAADFPPGAFEEGKIGATVFKFGMPRDGELAYIYRLKSSGHDDLDEAAEKIARQEEALQPGMFDGRVVVFVWPPKEAMQQPD